MDKQLTVYASPSPPMVSVNGNTTVANRDVVWLPNGERAEITCLVEGGYPAIIDMKIKCGAEESLTSDPSSTLYLDVTKGLHKTHCTCVVSHVSACYDGSFEFTIYVSDPTSIISYTILNEPNPLEVMQGTTLTFECQTEGNPSADIYIESVTRGVRLEGQTSVVSDFQSRYRVVQTMSVDMSDNYICQASNRIGRAPQQSLDITVKGPPTLFVDSRGSNIQRAQILDQLIRMIFRLFSRPTPRIVRLRRRRFGIRPRRQTTDNDFYEVDPSEYLWEFVQDNTQFGSIVLSMMNDGEMVKDFEATVINDFGEIKFPFTIDINQILNSTNGSSPSGGGSGSERSEGSTKINENMMYVGCVVMFVFVTLIIVGLVYWTLLQKEVKNKRMERAAKHRARRNRIGLNPRNYPDNNGIFSLYCK